MSGEADVQLVKTLTDPSVDKTREFSGLSKLKMQKKERHMSRLRLFAKFLEETNEAVVQNVLNFSREFRETMEVLDEDLTKFCAALNEDGFLIPKSERGLVDILESELRVKIQTRSDIVEKFAYDLDHTETQRAEVTGAELKRLVDGLIGIAHQLPDDIEHIVEAEAFELNTEIITNKNAHARTLAAHQIAQAQTEAACLQGWEDCRDKWRHLRHEKALEDFRLHIASPEFTDPSDRRVLMTRFRGGQQKREQQASACFGRLQELSCSTISSDAVAAVQAELGEMAGAEINAIQSCYDDLLRLQADIAYTAADRVEALRRELHVYGALKVEPQLHKNAAVLQAALDDPHLLELWRLGGGLKPEFQAQVADLQSDDVIYDRLIVGMQARLELVVCSFTLRGVLEERGRLAQLEKVRGLVTKMRTAPRAEVAGVLRALLPDLRDVEEVEQIPALFKEQVKEVVGEMEAELLAVEQRSHTLGSHTLGTGATGAHTLAGTGGGTLGTLSTKNPATRHGTGTGTGTGAGTGTGTLGATKTLGKTRNAKDPDTAHTGAHADPSLVKGWNRRLGVLYFGSDLPQEYQLGCLQSLELVREQGRCNALVDAVVAQESAVKLRRLDGRYKKLIDAITTYGETQAGMVAQASANVGDFFLATAKIVEHHRAEQKSLEDKSADEIWDLKEEFRFEREDREASYELACQKIREATKSEVLQENFQEVLAVLEGTQTSYRTYHSSACFANDRFPLYLSHEFRLYLDTLSRNFFLQPDAQHQIVQEYERVFDQTVRFNRKLMETPMGIERLPLPQDPALPQDLDLSPSEVEEVEEGEESVRGESGVEVAPPSPQAFRSPNMDAVPPPEDVFTGAFYRTVTENGVVFRFKNEDGAFCPPEPAPEAVEAVGAVGAVGGAGDGADGAGADGGAGAAALALLRAPHSECIYVTALSRLPLCAAEVGLLQEDDLDEYEAAMAKHFLDLGDLEEAPEVVEVKGKKPPVEEGPPHPLRALSPSQLEVYAQTKSLAARVKKRLAVEAEAAYIFAHPPLTPQGTTWVLVVEVGAERVRALVGGIRDSVIVDAEREACRRTHFAEKQAHFAKTELTDHLEDQIRNHWPRRGRVETQIKQPREAELLGHKEKTWRHIALIQQKMIHAMETFDTLYAAGKAECDGYITDMAGQRNSLSGDFKNLAFLQAIDVRARGISQSFEAAVQARVAQLHQLAQEETHAIAFFSRDFRKICPPQVAGAEGGYSASEITEIEQLVEGQCAEIEAVSAEWVEGIRRLEEQQQQSCKCQEEFSAKYKKCTQDVAMSEGLGQKYGAPRRRAQERIRTEVGRDERAAGGLDALLAKLEFCCAEVERVLSSGDYPEVDEGVGGAELQQCTASWDLLVQVRITAQQRVTYLRVVEGATPPLPDLPWMPQDRALSWGGAGAGGAAELAALVADAPQQTLEEVFEEVDRVCRKETRDLYTSEGLGAVLGEGGVPAALQQWLAESRDKLLGRGGHRERAWKRLWAQVARSEDVLARRLVAKDVAKDGPPALGDGDGGDGGDGREEESKYTTRLGVPAICLRSMTAAFIELARLDKQQKVAEFGKLLAVWEKGREKHERLLRPRLGSPDLADELTELDLKESQRSKELVEHVGRFRTLLVRSQTDHLKAFFEDAALCGAGLLQLLDSTLRQEQLQVPPDTAIPKKHMTLKKLRKQQRIREAVSQGAEDRSQTRHWDGIDAQHTAAVVRGAEDLVLDLGSDPKDTAAAPPPGSPDKGKKGAPKAPPSEAAPSLLSDAWGQALREKSAARGLVSTAHRIVVAERDAAVARFTQYIGATFEEVRADYDLVLRQEVSWIERWNRQVDMLRRGNV